jgi:tetrahydromethanopterin S-methyltransferase subunit G
MASLDERVAYLEGRLEDHVGTVTSLREDVRAVHTDLRSVREEVRNFRDEVRQELHRVDDKVSRHFTWLVGIQMGVLIAVLGALLGS